ncbi:hypothetical protein MRX96_013115 [Rhipicephalus microplus]
MEPPFPSSESSVRKKQRRSKLHTASIYKRPRCQNRRSSQEAFRKVRGASDNARRGATQEPDHDHRLCEIHVRFILLVETTCVGFVYGVNATPDSGDIAAKLDSAVPVVFCVCLDRCLAITFQDTMVLLEMFWFKLQRPVRPRLFS